MMPLRFSATFLLVLTLHAVWGVTILGEWMRYGEVAGPITALRTLHAQWTVHAPWLLGVYFCAEVALVLWAVWSRRAAEMVRFLLVLLPFVVCVYSAVDAIACTLTRQYADGVLHPATFIGKDQTVWMLLPVAYLYALVRHRIIAEPTG